MRLFDSLSGMIVHDGCAANTVTKSLCNCTFFPYVLFDSLKLR